MSELALATANVTVK